MLNYWNSLDKFFFLLFFLSLKHWLTARGFGSFCKLLLFCATAPLHSIYGRSAVVSSNGVQVSIHRRKTRSAAGAAQGRHISTPAVHVRVVPGGQGAAVQLET